MVEALVIAAALGAGPGAPTAGQAPAWPAGLTDGLTAVALERRRGDEPPRAVRVERRRGAWVVTSPRRGEADPDALDRLFFALRAPQLVGAPTGPPGGPVAFTIDLFSGPRRRRVTIWDGPLDAPRAVEVEGAGRFLVSPVELATKIPDPEDLLPPGLWVSAEGRARSLKVEGPVRYGLSRDGRGEWRVDGGRSAEKKLSSVVAVITGRHTVGVPRAGAARLGLDRPVARATLCAARGAGEECRTFRFSAAELDGARRTYAVGPDMDPVELRDDAWRLLVEGPFRP